MPDWKEPAFFAPPEAGGVATEQEYLALFAGATGKKAVGEASVAYLFAEEAPRRIYDFLGPDVKIVVILRNPVDMAYSLWGHQVREGFESLSFEDALRIEHHRIETTASKKIAQSWVYDFAYKNRASYAAQIKRYDTTFKSANIKVYAFEDFFSPGLPLFSDLCRFLGISENYSPQEKVYNEAGTVRSPVLRKLLRETYPWKKPLKKILPAPIRQRLRKKLEAMNRIDSPLPPMDESTRLMLEVSFESDVRNLEKCIKRSLKDVWF